MVFQDGCFLNKIILRQGQADMSKMVVEGRVSKDFLVFDLWGFNATFSNISALSWQPVLEVEEAIVPGEPPTMGKQLVNFITCGCESSAPLCVIYKVGREPTLHW
jgi:hypothetical protein